jgi:hypothetical protein
MEQAHSLAKKYYLNKSSNYHKCQASQKVCLSKNNQKCVMLYYLFVENLRILKTV